MGLDDLTGKAKEAAGEHSDKVEDASDKGLDEAGEFAEGKGLDSDKVDQGKEFLDDKVGDQGSGGDGGNEQG